MLNLLYYGYDFMDIPINNEKVIFIVVGNDSFNFYTRKCRMFFK